LDLQRFTIESLTEIDDGKIRVAFNGAVLACGRDCVDRYRDAKPRKVTLKAEFTPVIREDGSFSHVKTQLFLEVALPARRTNELHMQADADGVFYDADNVKDSHPTLPFDREDRS
jgi:hypothetical protein